MTTEMSFDLFDPSLRDYCFNTICNSKKIPESTKEFFTKLLKVRFYNTQEVIFIGDSTFIVQLQDMTDCDNFSVECHGLPEDAQLFSSLYLQFQDKLSKAFDKWLSTHFFA